MPFGDYDSMSDCISKNTGKVDDPGAYCASIHYKITGRWPSQETRHPDFQKIYNQFLTHVQDELEANSRYFGWIHEHELDERQYYGFQRRESHDWVNRHVDLKMWKEDADNKYWIMDVAADVESMNGNVYPLEELKEAARTIKGVPVSLNHRTKMPPLEIMAGQFNNGLVQCVLRVPKGYICPSCGERKTVNQLIEERGIIDASLEAACAYVSDDPSKCEGMYFTELTLLTKNVLPGIPLTRLVPLERIMVEALGADTTKKLWRKKMKIKMEVLADTTDCPPGEHWDSEQEKCVKDTVEQTDLDAEGQCPEGYILNDELGKCVEDTSCPEGQHWDFDLLKCMPDTKPEPVQAETELGHVPTEDVDVDVLSKEVPVASDVPSGGKTPPSQIPKSTDVATGAPADLPQPVTPTDVEPASPHDCGDGYHWDADINQCVPDQPITERVKRFKAEDKASTLATQVAKWEERYSKLDARHTFTLGQLNAAQQHANKMEKQRDEAYLQLHQEQINSKNWKRARDDVLGDKEDATNQLEKLKRDYNNLNNKYRDQLTVNLDLSKSVTKANEDYLDKAGEVERLQSALNKAKSISKKVVKLKV